MSRIIHRSFGSLPRTAVAAEGIEIIDQSGKRYIDASGGAAVSCLGHAHPDVLAAMHRQIDRLPYAHTGFFTSEVSERLAAHLVEHAPPNMAYVYFVSGGSEAMEAALKLARQHFVEKGEAQRSLFIGRRQSYHGNTLGALAVGGNEWRRRAFAPLLMDVARVSACFEYRERGNDESQEAYTDRLIAELESTIRERGPERIIAFVAETVGGATAGAVPPTPGYFRRVREICDRYGILMIADEVMCGMGRTGTLHAIEQEGCEPDFIVIAKGLGGGYQPIGAVLTSEKVVAPVRQGSGAFQHGHTYMCHPTAAAAALAVQEVIVRDGLLDRVRARGRYLADCLAQHFGQHPHVGDIRGRGLFMAVELVQDRATKETFAPESKLHARIKARALEEGLVVYPMGGTVDGRRGDHVLLAPPFIVSEANLEEIVRRLARAVDLGLREIGAI